MNTEIITNETCNNIYLSDDLPKPPWCWPDRNDPTRPKLDGEYYLDAHRNEIICHQVWSNGIVHIRSWNGREWSPEFGAGISDISSDDARRCWDHSVSNGATRAYRRVITGTRAFDRAMSDYSDPKSYTELAKEDMVWEETTGTNYALEA